MNENVNPQSDNTKPSEDPALAMKLGLTPEPQSGPVEEKKKEEDWMEAIYKKHTLSLLMTSMRRYGS